MPHRRVYTPVEKLQLFEPGHIVGLQEAGWTYRRIAAHVGHNVSVVCVRFQQWSVEHSHTRTPGSVWPCSTDASQDRRIMRALLAARTACREKIMAHVAPALSPRFIGNSLLAAGFRSRVSLVRLPLTPRLLWCRERVDWRVERHSVVFSDESRFCLCASDGRTGVQRTRVQRTPGERNLPECINPRYTDPTSGFILWEPSLTSRGHI